MNLEQFKPTEPSQERALPLSEHNTIQKALIEEFRATHDGPESDKNESALHWIAQFAGAFRQWSVGEDGARLLDVYHNAENEDEKRKALHDMQEELEKLRQPN